MILKNYICETSVGAIISLLGIMKMDTFRAEYYHLVLIHFHFNFIFLYHKFKDDR
eukprot:UN09233